MYSSRRLPLPSSGSLLVLLACCCAAVGPSRLVAQEAPVEATQRHTKIELNDENYASWRDHIRPHPEELNWEDIPWQTTFADGLLAADAAAKPLLFWTMNGHPLGCT